LPAGSTGHLFTIRLRQKDFREAINANTTPSPSRSGLASSMDFLRLGAGYLRIPVMIVNLRDDFSRPNG
jgi:hypothetical protein